MVDYEALNRAIDESGLKRNAIAERLGISDQTFIAKTKGKSELRLSEVETLCDVLRLSSTQRQTIFFSKK